MSAAQVHPQEDLFYKEFPEVLIRGDRNQCSEISNTLLESQATVQDVYEDLIRSCLLKE